MRLRKQAAWCPACGVLAGLKPHQIPAERLRFNRIQPFLRLRCFRAFSPENVKQFMKADRGSCHFNRANCP
jgi:hypothetical protein